MFCFIICFVRSSYMHTNRFGCASCLLVDSIVLVGGISQASNSSVVILNLVTGFCKKYTLQVCFVVDNMGEFVSLLGVTVHHNSNVFINIL